MAELEPVGTELLHVDATCRVWLLHLEPGEATEWHTHDCDYVYTVTQSGTARTEYEGGTSREEGDSVGDAVHIPRDQRHRLVNTGDTPYTNVVVELLATRPSSAAG